MAEYKISIKIQQIKTQYVVYRVVYLLDTKDIVVRQERVMISALYLHVVVRIIIMHSKWNPLQKNSQVITA